MKKREILAWISCIVCLGIALTTLIKIPVTIHNQDSSITIETDVGYSLVHMNKAQMMFLQEVTPIDPETEEIVYDQINITISGVVPPNVNATLVRNDDRVLVAKVHQLNIDCLYVDPYSLNITVGSHVRTWNGTTSSWNPVSTNYELETHRVRYMMMGMDEVVINEISSTRATVTIGIIIGLYIPISNVLWDLGGEYGIQFGIFIRVEGEMIRFGDLVSTETPIKNFEVSAP